MPNFCIESNVKCQIYVLIKTGKRPIYLIVVLQFVMTLLLGQDFTMTDELENRAEDVRSVCDNLLDEVGEERRMYTRLRYRRCLLVGHFEEFHQIYLRDTSAHN